MAARLSDVVAWCDALLDARNGVDYGPNGLQVEGRAEVRHVVCGVTACQALIDAAVARGADALLVHHGVLWGGTPTLTGAFGRRVRALVRADVSLLAYHLPLDRHLEVGNAAGLARRLGLTDLAPFALHKGLPAGVRGVVDGWEPEALAARLEALTGRAPTVFPFGPRPLRTVGIVTGGAPRDVDQALAAGLDAFITGEVAEMSLHSAREEGITFLAGGHHATERYGVQDLCARMGDALGVTWEFVDVPNPA